MRDIAWDIARSIAERASGSCQKVSGPRSHAVTLATSGGVPSRRITAEQDAHSGCEWRSWHLGGRCSTAVPHISQTSDTTKSPVRAIPVFNCSLADRTEAVAAGDERSGEALQLERPRLGRSGEAPRPFQGMISSRARQARASVS